FFPAAFFGIWGAARALRRGRWWAFYFAGACAATWLAFGMRPSWTAGNTYGERYFSVVCMVLALFAAEVEGPARSSGLVGEAWSAAFAYGVLLHGLGAAFQWPDFNATLAAQEAGVWKLRMFPLLHAFVDGGPIGATPQPWRTAYGLLIMALIAVPAWRWSRR